MTTFMGGSGNAFNVDIELEKDQGWFLGMTGERVSDGRELFDLIITEPSEIDYFFTEVAKAKAKWDATKEATTTEVHSHRYNPVHEVPDDPATGVKAHVCECGAVLSKERH